MADFAIAFAALACILWLWLLLFRHGFWRAGPRLAASVGERTGWPSVAAVIPARNEAEVIADSIASLLAQDYPGPFRIILVDDDSRDGTGERARAVAAAASAVERLEVVQAPPLEEGWTGKLWAMENGLRHIASTFAVTPRYVLFTDADIAHPPDGVRRLVAKAEDDRRDLVSLMAKLNCSSPWERLLIPAFVFFFQLLYPFPAVNDPRRATAAAAGGCMLVRLSALAKVGGLPALRNALIDDCALARRIQSGGGRLWLGLADDTSSLRVYRSLAEIWNMVARTAYTQLRRSLLLLLATIAAMALVYLFPPALLLGQPLHHSWQAAGLAGLAWLLMAVAYAPTVSYYGRSFFAAWSLPLAALLFVAMTVDSAFRHWQGKGGLWKGRHYLVG